MLIGGLLFGAAAGNFIRSWKTDENFHDARAKNRKATRIVQEAVEELESATEAAEKEQQRLLTVKHKAYDTLLAFVETFKTIDDVRFRKSNIAKEDIGSISQETISMLRDFEYEPTIVDNTVIGDAAGMLSMLLPVGIGSFGSFSSYQESKAALAEAEANVYEAQSTAREIESAVLVAEAVGERAKLLSDALSGIHTAWFKNATREFRNLVESKNSIKYYFIQQEGLSVYTDEEYEFIAMLAALSKTVKTLIDATLFDEKEKRTEELSEHPNVMKLTDNIQKQIQKDASFGLKKTYCGPLLTGEIRATELVRPGDSFVDDFAATRAWLEQKGYQAVCDFDDYLKSSDTIDNATVKKQYAEICDSIFTEELYRSLRVEIARDENEQKHGYGYRALCALKEALYESDDVSVEKEKLIVYVEEKIQGTLGKKGKPKFYKNGFAGLKGWVHMCLFELEGRRNEKMIRLGKLLSKTAIRDGYKNRMFKTLPTVSYYEDRKIMAGTWDCLISTVLFATVIGLLLYTNSFLVWKAVLVTCLYLLFVSCNKYYDVCTVVQWLSCLGIIGIGGYVFYNYAPGWITADKFVGINIVVLLATWFIAGMLDKQEVFRYHYFAKLGKVIATTSAMLYAYMLLDKFTEVKYALVLVVCCLMIANFMILRDLDEDVAEEKEKTARTTSDGGRFVKIGCALCVAAGAIVLFISVDLMENAGFWRYVLLIFILLFGVGWGGKATEKEGIAIKLWGAFLSMTGLFAGGMFVFGLLHCLLPLGRTFSLVVAEILYLIIAGGMYVSMEDDL